MERTVKSNKVAIHQRRLPSDCITRAPGVESAQVKAFHGRTLIQRGDECGPVG